MDLFEQPSHPLLIDNRMHFGELLRPLNVAYSIELLVRSFESLFHLLPVLELPFSLLVVSELKAAALCLLWEEVPSDGPPLRLIFMHLLVFIDNFISVNVWILYL